MIGKICILIILASCGSEDETKPTSATESTTNQPASQQNRADDQATTDTKETSGKATETQDDTRSEPYSIECIDADDVATTDNDEIVICDEIDNVNYVPVERGQEPNQDPNDPIPVER